VVAFFIRARTVAAARDFRVFATPADLASLLTQFARRLADVVWSWKPASGTTMDLLRNFTAHRAPAIEILLGLALAAVLLVVVLGARERRPSAGDASAAGLAARTFLLFEACYLAVLLASFLSTTPTPDIDRRTSLPLEVGALCAALSILAAVALRSGGRRSVSLLAAGAIALFALGYAVETADIVHGLHRTGLGYTAPRWQQSETIAAVSQIPPGQRLISDEPMPILLYTGRWPYPIAELEGKTPAAFTRFGLGGSQAETLFEQHTATLILFDSAADSFEALYPGRGRQRLEALVDDLQVTYRGADGAIYVRPEPIP
jgi:hypothetical protein